MSIQVDIPGYVAGSWVIDAASSEVTFHVRQRRLPDVSGSFDDFEGTIVTADDPRDSSATAVIRTASVNTRNKLRDKHLQTKGYLNTKQHPTITFASTGVRDEGGGILVDGDLTIRAVTKQVTLEIDVDGFSVGADGREVVRFTARTEINRDEYGVIQGVASAVIGKKVDVLITAEARKQG